MHEEIWGMGGYDDDLNLGLGVIVGMVVWDGMATVSWAIGVCVYCNDVLCYLLLYTFPPCSVMLKLLICTRGVWS